MNTKAKGSRNERRSMALLERGGWRCTKSGASLGCWDIVGVGLAGVVLVQVKSNRWPNAVEMEAMREFPCPSNGIKLIHRWNDRKMLPEVKEVQ